MVRGNGSIDCYPIIKTHSTCFIFLHSFPFLVLDLLVDRRNAIGDLIIIVRRATLPKEGGL